MVSAHPEKFLRDDAVIMRDVWHTVMGVLTDQGIREGWTLSCVCHVRLLEDGGTLEELLRRQSGQQLDQASHRHLCRALLQASP